jgi:hypothetical protein
MGNEPSAPHRGLTDKGLIFDLFTMISVTQFVLEIRVLKTNSNFNEEGKQS